MKERAVQSLLAKLVHWLHVQYMPGSGLQPGEAGEQASEPPAKGEGHGSVSRAAAGTTGEAMALLCGGNSSAPVVAHSSPEALRAT